MALEDLQFTISDQLFLDVLLMEIRSKTIAYTSKKKKYRKKSKGYKTRHRTWRTKPVPRRHRRNVTRNKNVLPMVVFGEKNNIM